MGITSNKDNAAVPLSGGSGGEEAASAFVPPSPSEDLFSLAVNNLLAMEVSSLVLLPRALMEWEQWQFRDQWQRGRIREGNTMEDPLSTGEERLLSRLQRAYKKDLDITEAYCTRNMFTMGQYPKTKCHMILKRYLAHEGELENHGNSDRGGGTTTRTTLTRRGGG
jgi:hypothetical protein